MYIIIFIVSLAILILVHEFGHFSIAKLFGIRVDEFGLGLPPRAWGKKFGETLYSLNWLPFGGFVKIFGEDPHDEEIQEADRSRSMYYKPKWTQALVLVAGVTFNLLFAWLLISFGFMIGLPSSVDYSNYGKVENVHVVVTDVLPNSPAEKAGLQAGDQIIGVGSGATAIQEKDLSPEKISSLIDLANSSVGITYKRRNADIQTVYVTPTAGIVTNRYVVGIAMDTIGMLRLSPPLALIEGAKTTAMLVKGTVLGLAGFFWNIVVFRSNFSGISGPVGIAHIFGQAGELGFVYILSLVALISINLAVINLVPFPALDGGRLLFIGIEAIIRRPIKPAVVRWTNMAGFVLLMALMLVITIHDVFKLF